MIRKKLSLTLLFVLTLNVFSTYAKSADDISATIKDSKTKQPLEFATVELLNEKDSTLIGCMADSKGYFQVTAPAKVAKLRIRYMGYKTFDAPLKEYDLGTLLMEEEASNLGEVTIKGKGKTNKIDRDVYYVTKEFRAGTVTSQELLGKLNGVNYNRYDRSITVNGSSKVLILVDGIEKDQDMVKNLPSDRIDRVEVIKDPVGKYAADGYTAVINILLKKDYSGVDMFITNTTFFDFVGSNGGDVFTQNFGTANVTYTYKKLNLFTSGMLYTGNFNIPAEYVKRYGELTSATTPKDEDHPNSSVNSQNGKITFGADYTLSKKHLVSAEFKYTGSKDNSSTSYDLINSLSNVILDTTFSFNKTRSHSDNLQGTVTYKGKFDENNTLDADVRYNHSAGNSFNFYEQDNFLSETNIKSSGDFVRTNVNYMHQFTPGLSLDLGYGNVYNQSTSKLLSQSFTQEEYRNRVSLYMSYRPIQKINTKVGGILENYNQKNSNKEVNQTAFMPFVNVQYIPNKNFNVVAKYHATSEYPDIDQLTVFKTAQDSLLWSTGNSNLKTGLDHELSMDFNVMNFITLTPYYTFSKSKIANYVRVDPENSNFYLSSPVNADKYNRFGASLNFTIPLGKTLFWQNRFDWNRNHMAYNGESYSGNNFNMNLSLFYVNQEKGWVAGAALQKMQRREIGIQGYSADGNDMMILLLQKSFLQKKLDVTLLYILPVKCLNYDQTTLTQTSSFYQRTTGSLGLIKSLAFVQLSYRFNAGKQVVKKVREDDSDAVKSKRGGIGL